MVPDVQEHEGRDEDDDSVCGEAPRARVAQHECAGATEAGRRIPPRRTDMNMSSWKFECYLFLHCEGVC